MRYSAGSVLTNPATSASGSIAISSNPINASRSLTCCDGAGVILSMTEIGNATFSVIHSTTLWSMTPRFSHSAAIVSTEVRNLSPLWEKLSQDTRATGDKGDERWRNQAKNKNHAKMNRYRT